MDETAYWRLKSAFEQVLLLAPAARVSYLAELAQTEPELAAALGERLACFETAVLDSPATAVMPSIPGYRLLSEAGAGGMGKVWLAQRLSDPEQKLALKQLYGEQLEPELLRRFAQERRALARLNHPHIASLVDAGVDEQGRPYLVTPWVDGARIDQWCIKANASLREKVRLVRDIAAALSHAHAQLIVHRDLKPANVLVDRTGQVRVVDFGIAKLIDQDEQPSTALPMMTLRYAAPEQVAGDSVGPGCDLYALGVLFYELISGKSPYGEQTHPSALAHAIAHGEIVAPKLGAQSEATQRDLHAIVLKLLRKRPQDRYGSAQELALDLERWLAGTAVHARSDERGYLLRRWLRRWRFALAAAALAPMLLGWHVWRLDQQLKQTALQRDRARAVADFFVQLFRQARPGEAREGEVSARTLLDRSVERLRAPNSELSASTRSLLQWVSARVYSDLGRVQEAEPLLAEAIAQLEKQSPAPTDELIEAYRTHAGVLYQLDRVSDSLARSLAAIALMEAQQETNSERYAGILQNAAIAASSVDQARADALFQRALAVLERNQAQMQRAYVLLLLNMGGDYTAQYKHTEAARYFTRAAAAIKGLNPPDTDLQLTVRRALIESRLELGVPSDALAALSAELVEADAAALAHYGKNHLEYAFWQELAGILAIERADAQRAKAHFDLANSLASQLFGDPANDYRVRFALSAALADALVDSRQDLLDAQLAALLQQSRDDSEHRAQIQMLSSLARCSGTQGAESADMLPRWQRQLMATRCAGLARVAD